MKFQILQMQIIKAGIPPKCYYALLAYLFLFGYGPTKNRHVGVLSSIGSQKQPLYQISKIGQIANPLVVFVRY